MISHAVRPAVLFEDDVDRTFFLSVVAETVRKLDWTCMEICLLDTHYHLLVETCDWSLSAGMHRINHRHACRYNARHRRRGHVTEARFYSRRIRTEADLIAVYGYIARNPVRAGICTRCEDWPWGSYSALIKGSERMSFVDPSRVLGCLSDDRERAIEMLRAYVDGAVMVL